MLKIKECSCFSEGSDIIKAAFKSCCRLLNWWIFDEPSVFLLFQSFPRPDVVECCLVLLHISESSPSLVSDSLRQDAKDLLCKHGANLKASRRFITWTLCYLNSLSNPELTEALHLYRFMFMYKSFEGINFCLLCLSLCVSHIMTLRHQASAYNDF